MVYDILIAAEYDDSNKILTDYKNIIIAKMQNVQVNLRTLTLQFASFIVKEIELYGKEILSKELPFNEFEALNDNMSLIKTLTNTKNIDVVEYSDITKPKQSKTVSIPGKPIITADDK